MLHPIAVPAHTFVHALDGALPLVVFSTFLGSNTPY